LLKTQKFIQQNKIKIFKEIRNLTPRFEVLFINYEGNYYLDMVFIEAAVRAFYGWCKDTKCPGNTNEAI